METGNSDVTDISIIDIDRHRCFSFSPLDCCHLLAITETMGTRCFDVASELHCFLTIQQDYMGQIISQHYDPVLHSCQDITP
jgi:hypothetical protein